MQKIQKNGTNTECFLYVSVISSVVAAPLVVISPLVSSVLAGSGISSATVSTGSESVGSSQPTFWQILTANYPILVLPGVYGAAVWPVIFIVFFLYLGILLLADGERIFKQLFNRGQSKYHDLNCTYHQFYSKKSH